MGGIANGQLDESRMLVLGTGWDKHGQWFHKAPPGTAARWEEIRRLAWEKYRVWLWITPGWNVYRPLWVQRLYRADLGIWAAWPGTSSHGGEYQGRSCCAIDVGNWGDLGWARFVALCRIVGFTVDFVTPQELWHIGDFDPWNVPQFAAIEINHETTALPVVEEEEDDMAKMKGATYTRKDGTAVCILFNEVSGFYSEHTGAGGTYNNPLAQAWETGSWPTISESHARALKASLDLVKPRTAPSELTVAVIDGDVTG